MTLVILCACGLAGAALYFRVLRPIYLALTGG